MSKVKNSEKCPVPVSKVVSPKPNSKKITGQSSSGLDENENEEVSKKDVGKETGENNSTTISKEHQVSISSTFFARVFCTKRRFGSFFSSCYKYVEKLRNDVRMKNTFNVDEIDGRQLKVLTINNRPMQIATGVRGLIL